MRYEIFIALRHLLGRKSAFLSMIAIISVIVVCVSSCALCTVISVMKGFGEDLKKKILGTHAHIIIDSPRKKFKDFWRVIKTARDIPEIVGITPYIEGEAMLASPLNRAGMLLRGIEPSSISKVTNLVSTIETGKLEYLIYPEKLLKIKESLIQIKPPYKDKRQKAKAEDMGFLPLKGAQRALLPGIIIGRELARSLNVYLGEEVDVISPFGDLAPSGPVPKIKKFRIAGVFYSGMYEYDMKYCYALLSEVQDFFGRPDEITGLEVKVKDISNSKVTAKALARLLKDDQYRVRDWREINKGLFSALKLERMVMFVLLCLLVFVAAFGIVSTLMMMVQEKGKEIAVLKALGVSTLSVVRVFITEGLFLGGIGTILGLFMGFLSCIFIEKYGIALDPEVYYINQLPVEMDIKEFIKIAVSAISISLLATIYPALQAARVRPTEGLRYE